MITLIMSTIATYPEYYRIIGYVLTAIEALMIIIRIIYNFTPEGSKFARFLEFIFKGLKKSKKTLSNPVSEELKDKDEKKDGDE